MPSAASMPLTTEPRSAANRQNSPLPQPTSSTCVPSLIPVASATAAQAGIESGAVSSAQSAARDPPRTVDRRAARNSPGDLVHQRAATGLAWNTRAWSRAKSANPRGRAPVKASTVRHLLRRALPERRKDPDQPAGRRTRGPPSPPMPAWPPRRGRRNFPRVTAENPGLESLRTRCVIPPRRGRRCGRSHRFGAPAIGAEAIRGRHHSTCRTSCDPTAYTGAATSRLTANRER
jgi:hypothetical protein